MEEVLERLDDLGYLDDRQAARSWAEAKLRRGRWGRRRLLADLQARGAPREVAAEVLDELLPGDDVEVAAEAAEAWRRRRPRGGRQALARYLERRGFSSRAILRALGEPEE